MHPCDKIIASMDVADRVNAQSFRYPRLTELHRGFALRLSLRI
jgi:hypothetical protein